MKINNYVSEDFILLFLLQKKLKKLFEEIELQSERGIKWYFGLWTEGRKIKQRGKLFIQQPKDNLSTLTIAHLLFNKDTIPFYLFCVVKNTLKNHFSATEEIEIRNTVTKLWNHLFLLGIKNIHYVVIVYKKLKRKFYNIDLFYEDLMLEGFMGMLNGFMLFQAEKKVKPLTYLYYWCEKYMKEYLQKNLHFKKLQTQYQLKKLKKVKGENFFDW